MQVWRMWMSYIRRVALGPEDLGSFQQQEGLDEELTGCTWPFPSRRKSLATSHSGSMRAFSHRTSTLFN
jgi:hypothetical protein